MMQKSVECAGPMVVASLVFIHCVVLKIELFLLTPSSKASCLFEASHLVEESGNNSCISRTIQCKHWTRTIVPLRTCTFQNRRLTILLEPYTLKHAEIHGPINSLGPIADISVMRLSASQCHFRQCPWDLGSASAERVGRLRKLCKQRFQG